MCIDPCLSHNNVCTPELTSITDEKVRSDSVYRPFFSVADSLEITGRIESLNSIGCYNCSEARYYSFREMDLSLNDYYFIHVGGVLVCNPTSTRCHGDADTPWGHFLLFVFWLWCFGGMIFLEKLIRMGCICLFALNKAQTETECSKSVCTLVPLQNNVFICSEMHVR